MADRVGYSVEQEDRLIAQTMGSLSQLMRPHCEEFPGDYLAIDCETTGFNPREDKLVQIGYCSYRDGITACGAVTLDWTTDQRTDQVWLRERLRLVKERMAEKGKPYHVTYESMQQGAPPKEALEVMFGWLQDIRAARQFVVAHNGQFDERFLDAYFRSELGRPWEFGPYELFDTGLCLKAALSATTPWSNETPKMFYARVASMRLKGIFWGLDGENVKRFGLHEKHGVAAGEAHHAGADSLLCHHLFQHFLHLARLYGQN